MKGETTIVARRTRPEQPRPLPDDLQAISAFVEVITRAMRSPLQCDRIAKATGLPLTIASLSALRAIEQTPALSATEVAARLGVDASTVSRQLRPLEEHELITRTADTDDRRVILLHATDAGRQVLRRVETSTVEALETALDGWSPDDRALLGHLLGRLRDDMLRPQ